MTRTPVTFSRIASIGYDPASRLLEVEFRGGAIYQYQDVPPQLHAALLGAPSVGKHFNAAVRGQYSHRRLDAPAPAPEAGNPA